MNKLLGCIYIFAGALLCVSCENDDLPTPTTPLAIASQNVAFTSVGGTGSVVVGIPEDTLTTVRAVTDADWATVSVSGNTITVEAKENPNITSRAASLKIYSGSDSVTTSISQLGLTFNIEADKENYLDDQAQQGEVTIQHTLPVQLVHVPEWVDITSTDNGFVYQVEENKTGAFRRDYIKIQTGNVADSILIAQGELADLVGDIILTGYNSKFNTVSYSASIQVAKDDKPYLVVPDLGVTYPFQWNQKSHQAIFLSGTQLGTFNYQNTAYSIYPIFVSLADGATIFESGYGIGADFVGEDGITLSEFKLLGLNSSDATEMGIAFGLFDGEEATKDTYTGINLAFLYYPSLIKLPAQAAAKSNIPAALLKKKQKANNKLITPFVK
jgi:hypothetical protein